MLVSPAPQNVGVLGTLSALNLLRLFMALCCFLESRLLSVSFQPQAACVAPPQCCQLGSETPQPLCSLGRSPAFCLQPGGSSELCACRHQPSFLLPERGSEGCCSGLSGKALPSLAWRGSLVTLSFLLVLSDSPHK